MDLQSPEVVRRSVKTLTASVECVYIYISRERESEREIIIIIGFRNFKCVLLEIERGIWRTGTYLLWIENAKVIEAQSFVGRLLKVVEAVWC